MTPMVRSKKLVVPDVVGLKLNVAETVIKHMGFAGIDVHYVESYDPPETVIAQDPTRGSLLEEHKKILVRVAKKSFLRFLPSIYHPKTADEPSFLREYLWIFHHLFDSITKKLDRVHELFNPYSTPPGFLPWLASWFAISFDEDMSEAKRRQLVKEAVSLFAIRGTKRALIKMIKLTTDLDVEIEENCWPFKGLRVGVSSRIGVDTLVLPEILPSSAFVVNVPKKFDEISEATLVRLHKVIEEEKPSSSIYFLRFKEVEGVTEYVPVVRVGLAPIGVFEEQSEG